MKKSMLLLGIFVLCLGQKSFEQCTPWCTNGNTLTGASILGGVTSDTYDIYFYDNATQYMDLQYNTGALGIGIGLSPGYQLDVLCPVGTGYLKDINVSSNGSSQNVGYRIGGQMVMWHNGDPSSFYLGVGAGFAVATVGGQNNTFVGFNSGGANGGTGGQNNTATGYKAGSTNSKGSHNTYIGSGANANSNGYSNSTALGSGTTITASNQMNISGNGNITSFVIPNITGATPSNTATPVAWEKVTVSSATYYIPLYQ